MTYAIDYASVDGDAPPDFARVKSAGYGIVGVRGAWGYHGRASTDPTLARDVPAARAAGLQVFGYLFHEYGTDPAAEAKELAAGYRRLPGDLPVALDLEMDAIPPGTTAAQRLKAAEDSLAALRAIYGQCGVMVYSSQEQWVDHFGDLDSAELSSAPLWLKTPYAWNPRNPPHLESCGPLGELPRPWRRPGSPGAWLQQFQGDAIGILSNTVDVSKFLSWTGSDLRCDWIDAIVGPAGVSGWQRQRGLVADGIVGPRTFAALCQ